MENILLLSRLLRLNNESVRFVQMFAHSNSLLTLAAERTSLYGYATFCQKKCGSSGGSVVKNPPADAGDSGLIPNLGRSSGEEDDNPLQYSCLENPMDRGAWQATYSPWVTKRHDSVTE